jgi:hypothetical protein
LSAAESRQREIEKRRQPQKRDAPDVCPSRLLSALVRFRWIILLIWAAYLLPATPRGWVGDWRYFVEGSRLLLSEGPAGPAGGLHIFANYPFLQVGPLSLIAAHVTLLTASGTGYASATVAIMALGLATVLLVERAAKRAMADGAAGSHHLLLAATSIGGVILLKEWSVIAAVGHLDDALTLTLGAAAVYCVVRRQPALAGIAVGLAVAAKPWGVFVVPALFALRGRLAALACGLAATIAAVAWLPFVIADPRTLAAGKYTILNQGDSTLRILGVGAATTPEWVRPTQLVVCLLVGSLIVRRGRWPAFLLVAVAARLVLDGGTYVYYDAGLVLGALLVDVLVLRFPAPIATFALFAALQILPPLTPTVEDLGIARTAILAACLLGPFAPAPSTRLRRALSLGGPKPTRQAASAALVSRR